MASGVSFAYADFSGVTTPIVADGVTVGPYTNVNINAGTGKRAVYATNNGVATVVNGNLYATSSTAQRGFGLLAGKGGEITSGANITMTGDRGHAVQAGFNGTGSNTYDGSSAGTVTLTGGNIVTNGDYAVGLHAVDSGVITANGVTVETRGPNSPGAHAESNSEINITGSSISTVGGSHGVLANNDRTGAAGGVVNLTDTTINTAGGNGVRVEKGGSANVTGGSISTTQDWAFGVYATGAGSEATLNGGSINTSNERAYGLLADTGAVINSSANITTAGKNAHAVNAGANGTGGATYPTGSAGTVNLTGGDISTSGVYALGLHAVDAGVINASGVAITTSGATSFGAQVESESRIDLANSSIATSGAGAHGVVANNDQAGATGGVINLTNTAITTTGANAMGLVVAAGASANVTGGSISTTQDWAYGVYATGAGSEATLNGGSINTQGQRAYGLLADNGAVINSSANITTTGDRAHAVQTGANGTGGATYPTGSAGTINLTGGNIATGGVYALGLHAVDAGVINASGVAITTSGATSFGAQVESESRIDLANSSIATSGAGAHGVVANNDRAGATGGVINLTNVAIAASGENAHGAVAEAGGQINMAGGSLTAGGAGGAGLALGDGATANVNGGSIASAQDAAVRIHNNAALALNNVSVQGATATIATSFSKADQSVGILVGSGAQLGSASGVLLSVDRSGAGGDSGKISLTLADGSSSRGDIVDQGVKTTGYTDLELGAGANWSGVAYGVRNFTSHQRGGAMNFGDGTVIEGVLSVSQTQLTFSPAGAIIVGDVTLSNSSSSTGGSLGAPIIVGGDVSVDASSAQGGNWRIGGNLINYGMLRPGNSIGLVQVGGNLNLAGTSVYQAEINAAGQADLIAVAGVANLAGRVEVSPWPANGGFLVGTAYTIVSAGGGFGGSSFDGGVAWSNGVGYIFLAPSLSYDAHNAYVTIGRSNVTMASVALTPNQASAATAIDRLPVTNALFGQVALQTSAAGARQAFDAISGEAHASLAGALIEDSRQVRDAVNNRLLQAFGGSVATANSARTQAASGLNATIWGQGFGSWGHASAAHGASAKAERSSAGFLAGVDAPVFDTWRFGLAAGYTRTSVDVDQRLSSASVDSYHLALYGGSTFGAIGVRFGAAYTWNDADARRGVAFPGFADSARSSYRSGVAQVFGETSYAARFGATAVEPFLNVAWVNLDSDRFQEYGGAAALMGKTSDMNTAFTTLGARIAHTFAMANGYAVTARGVIGWRHAFGDVDPRSWMSLAGGASSFNVTGAPIARNSLLLEAGLDMNIAANVTLGVAWTGQLAERAQDNSVKGNFAVRF
ncbi:autotransporter domain-containing protein [Camelimonas sp. ID_303_24]